MSKKTHPIEGEACGIFGLTIPAGGAGTRSTVKIRTSLTTADFAADVDTWGFWFQMVISAAVDISAWLVNEEISTPDTWPGYTQVGEPDVMPFSQHTQAAGNKNPDEHRFFVDHGHIPVAPTYAADPMVNVPAGVPWVSPLMYIAAKQTFAAIIDQQNTAWSTMFYYWESASPPPSPWRAYS